MTRIDICTILLNDSETERQTIYWDVDSRTLRSDYDGEPIPQGECTTYEEACDIAWALWGKSSSWDLDWIEPDDRDYVNSLASPMTEDEIKDAIEFANAMGPSDEHGDIHLMNSVENFWEPGYDFSDPELWSRRENLTREMIVATVRYDLWKQALEAEEDE